MREQIVLLTRPLSASQAVAHSLRERGFSGRMILSPIMQIDYIRPATVHDPDAAAIYSSGNGVRAAIAARIDMSRPTYCVGAATAELAQSAGADIRAICPDQRALSAWLCAHKPQTRFQYYRGAVSAGNLAAELRAAGLACQEYVVYEQNALPLTIDAKRVLRARGQMLLLLPLYSPRSARLLRQAIEGPVSDLHVICLSQAVALAWGGDGQINVVEYPDARSMEDRILRLASSHR